ncbi:MAG: DNA translocase FtsK 4TM domain-containing protein, partial [Ginsengibacter sp.]
MANTRKNKKNKTTSSSKMKADIEEKVEVKKLLKDERSHKIAGTLLILIAFLLFVSFTSYLFTWQEDQSKVFKGAKILLPSHAEPMNNLLGTGGAYFSDLFFRSGFGIASYLFCTFFFVAGVNLFSPKKKFSLSRNVRYVIVGLLVISVSASFLMNGHPFPWGGVAGDMASGWLQQVIGRVGTAALLLAAMFSYIIWRFNPSFNFQNKKFPFEGRFTNDEAADRFHATEEDESDEMPGVKSLILPLTNNPLKEDNLAKHDFEVFEKADEQLLPEKPVMPFEPQIKKAETDNVLNIDSSGLMLEVKTVPDVKEEEKAAIPKPAVRPPYDPILDLRNYKFPKLDLLEAHGSEKIVQDVTELETNKNQIINTLKNYDIEIQKISATVGPTVTLYEIVPAPGVRISRIKNLEDDIALSLAALGIRIIAPIPGKGTIGIEVPNVKKTVVSMKTLLNSDKFQNNHFSLPIAIGKKIDNENFIVDLTTMPHLLMAGATGQGKSVGLNAILVSLLYKKHPSQLKFVLIDPKKVELSIYQSIEKHFLAKLPGEEDAIITDTKKVIHTLNALCIEMDNRYDLLKEAGTRNIKEYNEKFVSRKLNPEKGHQYLPFIVLVIDEFADLIMTAGKEVEMPIARLAQLARAVGIHL